MAEIDFHENSSHDEEVHHSNSEMFSTGPQSEIGDSTHNVDADAMTAVDFNFI